MGQRQTTWDRQIVGSDKILVGSSFFDGAEGWTISQNGAEGLDTMMAVRGLLNRTFTPKKMKFM